MKPSAPRLVVRLFILVALITPSQILRSQILDGSSVRPSPTTEIQKTDAPSLTPTTPSADGQGNERINSNLVTLSVRVIDGNNRPVTDVRQEELKVYENGVPQEIGSFSHEEAPVIYGLAIDTSGSMRSEWDRVIAAAKTIIKSNNVGDETFLERFVSSDKIETIQDFTSNKDALMDGLDTLFVEGGQSAVIDGVYNAAVHVAEYKKGSDDERRALIVITDGNDEASYYTETQLFQRLREDNLQIYVIGFVNELSTDKALIRRSSRERAVNLLNKIGSQTGGRVFYPQSISEFPNIANEILRDLRSRYVIKYGSTNKALDGSSRSITVQVADAPSGDRRIALTRSVRTLPTISRSAQQSGTPVVAASAGTVKTDGLKDQKPQQPQIGFRQQRFEPSALDPLIRLVLTPEEEDAAKKQGNPAELQVRNSVREKCDPDRARAAQLRGFHLEMTVAEVRARLPQLKVPPVDRVGYSRASIVFTPKTPAPSQIKGVRSMVFDFLDSRLTYIGVAYDNSVTWSSLDEFVSQVSGSLGVPNRWDSSSYHGQELRTLQCGKRRFVATTLNNDSGYGSGQLSRLRDSYAATTREYRASLEKLLALYEASETKAEQRLVQASPDYS